jgi:hypothetical protein
MVVFVMQLTPLRNGRKTNRKINRQVSIFKETTSFCASTGNSLETPSAVLAVDDMFDPEDRNHNVIIRYCRALLAWVRAALSLSRLKIFRDPLARFHLICTYLPMHNKTMTQLPDLMTKIILPKLEPSYGLDNSVAINQLVVRKDFANKNKTEFTGKIHCEATIMALVHSFSSRSRRVAPFSKDVTAHLRPFFTVSVLFSTFTAH